VRISLVLAAFAAITALTQLFNVDPAQYEVLSIPQFAGKLRALAGMTNMLEFDATANPFDAACRRLDLGLPPNARVYLDDMLGATNLNRAHRYQYLAYYLFPREVATSLDQPARITREGFVGRAAKSYEEMATNDFDAVVVAGASTIKGRPLRDLALRPPVSPEWFPSRRDAVIAFLLPLLTALSGLGLVRLLFPALEPRLPFLEKLACGFGLGMMVVAALTLGVKLCGWHGRGLVLVVTGAGGIFGLWHHRRTLCAGIPSGLKDLIRNPVTLPAGMIFFLVFVAAGMVGLVESDAVGAWMLKAKIMYMYSGGEMLRWFSEPRLAHAHLDYPTLVPSLHAATFDSIGRVDEYVTKFWPAWMLLLLVGALASLNREGKSWLHGPSFFLLALVLLPATRLYVEMEGGTMPMVFFTTLGLLECVLGQSEPERGRLGLGLTLLFGGAMAKFEGFIILGAALVWLVLLTRPSKNHFPSFNSFNLFNPFNLTNRPVFLVPLAFCLASAAPFLCLRLQIPALHYESGWAREALGHPALTLANLPPLLLMMTARWFASPTLATWSGEGGHLHWAGKWEGISSLYNHSTLGLAWLALALTLALWFLEPARRSSLAWTLAVMASVLAGFSLVFASFVRTMGLTWALDYYTADFASGRYLFPLLVAWSATIITLLFRQEPQPAAAMENLA